MAVIIHKDIVNNFREHDTNSDHCWCEPLIINDFDLVTNEELIELDRINNLKS